jgi:hypothetical protein
MVWGERESDLGADLVPSSCQAVASRPPHPFGNAEIAMHPKYAIPHVIEDLLLIVYGRISVFEQQCSCTDFMQYVKSSSGKRTVA